MTADLTPTTDAATIRTRAEIVHDTAKREKWPLSVQFLAGTDVPALLELLAERDATIAQLLAAVEYLYRFERAHGHESHTEPADTCTQCAYTARRDAEIRELILRHHTAKTT